jgi:pimeloyl-ACP methyl ester carboxylesterase
VNGQLRCVVVAPKEAAPGNPWSWRGYYFDHEPQAEIELLRRGFHIGFIWCDAGKPWDAWYAFLTEQHGLSTKPAFIGMSRGGRNAYTWATAHADRVACIYADNPAVSREALALLGGLAKYDVPLLHVCGSLDPILGKQTLVVESAYQHLGGRISVMIKDGAAHHPHSLRDPKLIADFIEQSLLPTGGETPVFVGKEFTKTSFYGVASDYREVPSEKTFAACRGPWFAPAYDRYEFRIGGIRMPVSVIVPNAPAPGKPWVFRADFVTRDAAVDLALLGEGFHVVTGPVPTDTDGPVLAQWNTVYKHLTEHGLSKTPVLEGAGGAAGEAYAWAIENPEKVSCIYAENPILRSHMTRTQPLDRLDVLSKAGVPLLHVCGSRDPWLDSQTRVLEKRYKELGGPITVLVKEGQGHFPLAPKNAQGVVDFITKRVRQGSNAAAGGDANVPSAGEKTSWHGFDRYDFVMDEQTLAITPRQSATGDEARSGAGARCILVVPKKRLAGNPWSWRDLYRDHQAPAETELLTRGFHVAFITPGPPRQREAWLAFLTEKHRLARKPVVVGLSTAGELRAGTAKLSITPENLKVPVHDPCYARSLVLDVGGERVAIVAVDLGVYTNEHLVAACKERFGIAHLLLSSSHTHSGPGREHAPFFEDRILQVVEAAVKNMFPARLSAGRRSFPQLGFNRLVVREDGHARESWFGDDHYTSENPERIPFGPVDPEVGVIKVEDMQGRPRAIVMNYACHADVVCQNYAISADFPGAATRKVEEALGGGLNCLFVQGAGGNIESLIISSRRTGPDDSFQTDYSTIERVGALLASETVKIARSLRPAARPETTIRYMEDSLKFTGRFDKDAALDVHFSTILINDNIVIATFPGEPFIQLQLDWKRKADVEHPFLFGYTWHAGTWPNYVPDIKSAALGGYGADQSSPKMIEVGSGEAVMSKHLENLYRLTGLMREAPGPVGFKPGPRYRVTPVPRDK